MNTPDPVSPERIEDAILELARRRGPGKTICPSEAARAVAGADPDAWGRLMPHVRRVAIRMMKDGRIAILRKGRPVDPDDFKGVYRIALVVDPGPERLAEKPRNPRSGALHGAEPLSTRRE